MNEFNEIGDRYFDGDGVEQSYETAFSYYLKAAEMGDAEGFYNLGWCYERGLGTERSETDAIINYSKAGELGFVKAWRCLGFMLFFSVTGDDDPRLPESFKYMLKAADLGDAAAQAHVAQGYQGGAGWGAPEVDLDKAKEYLAKAVEQGNEHAMWVLAENYATGSFGYEENPELALEYYRKAAEAGSYKAKHDMAVITYFGYYGVDEDPEKALELELDAYREGDIGDSSVFLGALLMHGLNEETADEDYETGKQLIAEAAGCGIHLADYLNARIPVVEKGFGRVTPLFAKNLLYLGYIMDHHEEYEREEKELFVEVQWPGVINAALDGDFNACVVMSRAFLLKTEENEELGGELVYDLELFEKWSRIAYECDKLKGLDLYLSALALLGHIDFQIGAYDHSESKRLKVCELLEEAKGLAGYEGLADDPKKCAGYYDDLGFIQLETKKFSEAYRSFDKANAEYRTSDALFGLFNIYANDESGYLDWPRAVDYITRACSLDAWEVDERKAKAHFMLGIMYRDPAFAPFIKSDINKSYELMSIAASLGFDPAKEELTHYKQGVFGGYKYV